MSSGVRVHLNQFEGPLGLLLFLIRKEEMDIMDINIGQITDQYLTYIKNMGSLDLENAGDFVAMAATLIHIKSKMLLPNYVEEDEELAQDPRKELVQKLLEYQVYKEASQKLYERSLLNRDTWIKGAKEALPEAPDDQIEVEDNALFSLILSYRKAVKRMKRAVHRVASKMQSVASRILEIQEMLRPGVWTSFFEIMDASRKKMKEAWEREAQGTDNDSSLKNHDEDEKNKLLITFLSLLELGKIGFVKVFQSETYGNIHIEPLKKVERDVISQVEEYENLDQEESAQALFNKGNLSLDLSEDDFDEDLEVGEEKAQGQQSVQASNEAIEEVDAATDEDIEEEEKRLGLENLDLGLET